DFRNNRHSILYCHGQVSKRKLTTRIFNRIRPLSFWKKSVLDTIQKPITIR
ncbi:unnamed protein product, partial [Tenebrio molitor]